MTRECGDLVDEDDAVLAQREMEKWRSPLV
jgi:hypothetical protein